MTIFDERERAFEQLFVHDEELRFRARARRNKLLGRWAAMLMGLQGAQADLYAREVVDAVLQADGDRQISRKIRDDLAARGVRKSDDQLRAAMAELMAEAIAQVKDGA
jgi:hypothetical protein